MSAPVSLCLARTIARHAAATRRKDAGADALAAMDGLTAALEDIASADDVAAVLAHADRQDEREGEPGAQNAVSFKLVAALARRAFEGPLAA